MNYELNDKKRFTKAALLLSAVLLFCLANFVFLYQKAKNELILKCENEVLQAAAEVGFFLVESVDAVKLSSYTLSQMLEKEESDEAILTYLEDQSEVFLKTIDGTFTGLYGVFNGTYLDGAGWVPEPGYKPQERPWYRAAAAMQGEVALVAPYLDSQTGSMMMSVARLLSDNMSVVALDIRLDAIQKLIENTGNESRWTMAMVLDSEGRVVAHSDETELGKTYTDAGGSMGNRIYTGIVTSENHHFTVRNGPRSYYVFWTDLYTDWSVVTVMEKKDFILMLWPVLLFFAVVSAGVLYLCIRILKKERSNYRINDELKSQLQAAATVFQAAYMIDLEKDTFRELSATEEIREILGDQRKGVQHHLRLVMDAMTDARYKARIFEFINLSTIDERFDKQPFVEREYINRKNQRCRLRFILVDRNAEGRTAHMMLLGECLSESKE
ncbi:MAG: cache domain-containing protein [Lachnospiraceae bacterium]|nr:cache domain-containing protein [Lachnospiraceae bacterium]